MHLKDDHRMPFFIALLSIAFSSFIGLAILISNPSFYHGLGITADPDAVHYWQIAVNIVRNSAFSRSVAEPFIPDLIRVPMYPLFLSMFAFFSLQIVWIFISQVVLYAVSCSILYYTVLNISNSTRVAVVGAVFMAMNASAMLNSFKLLTEIPFLFLFVAYLYCFVLAFKTGHNKYHIFSVLLIGLMTLTKPVAQYLILLHLFLFIIFNLSFSTVNLAKLSGSFFLCYLLVVGPWIIRNIHTFSIPRVSVIDTHNFIYYIGATGYIEKESISLHRAYDRIAEDFNIPSYPVLQNLFIYNLTFPVESYKALYNQLDGVVKWNVVRKYPGYLLIGIIKGFLKSHLSHNVNEFGNELIAKPWVSSGTVPTSGFVSKISNIFNLNGIANISMFIYQYAYMIILYILAAIGLYSINSGSMKPVFKFGLIAILLYSYLNIIGAGIEASQRFRMMSEIIYYIFAGFGFEYLFHRTNAALTSNESVIGS
ncbi:MAG: glycosyltransferase family 39 protein [Syntrophobacteraceae bacterium]